MFRRLSILSCGLLLAACSSGTTIGPGELGYTPTPSAKKTTPKPTPKKTTPKPTPTKTVVKPTGPAAKTHNVVATSGYQYDPSDFAVRKGDKVKFTNTHSGGPKHSWTVTGYPIDSGELAPGQSATMTINIAPGTYQFSCTVVPYMVAGSMLVV